MEYTGGSQKVANLTLLQAIGWLGLIEGSVLVPLRVTAELLALHGCFNFPVETDWHRHDPIAIRISAKMQDIFSLSLFQYAISGAGGEICLPRNPVRMGALLSASYISADARLLLDYSRLTVWLLLAKPT
jgi:hypothetical protein